MATFNMNNKEQLIKEIEEAPDSLVKEATVRYCLGL